MLWNWSASWLEWISMDLKTCFRTPKSQHLEQHLRSCWISKAVCWDKPKMARPKLSTGGFKFFHQSSQTSQVWLRNQSREPKFPSCINLSPEIGPPGSHCSLSWRLCLWPSRASGEGDACEALLRWIRSRSSTRLAGKAFVNLYFHGKKSPAGSKWWIFYIDIPSGNLT